MVVYQSGPSTKGDYATSSTAFILEAEGEGVKTTATKKGIDFWWSSLNAVIQVELYLNEETIPREKLLKIHL